MLCCMTQNPYMWKNEFKKISNVTKPYTIKAEICKLLPYIEGE